MRAPHLKFACPRRWAAMPGDDVRRFCEGCREHVHDLSAMEPSVAERFLAEHHDACLRFAVDDRGRVVFRSRRLAVVATAAALAGCAGWDEAAESTAPSDEFSAWDERAAEMPDAHAIAERPGAESRSEDAPDAAEPTTPARRDAQPRSIEFSSGDESLGRRAEAEPVPRVGGRDLRRKLRKARKHRRGRTMILMGYFED